VGGDSVGEVNAVQNTELDSDLLGITAFVPYGVPGEEILAEVIENKKTFLRAKLLEVVTESLDREVAPCPYYQNCGGCEIQHIDYRAQVEFKKAMVLGALRSAKFTSQILDLVPDLIKSEPFNYRRRINLHVDRRGSVGFYQSGSRTIVPIKECLIASKELQNAITNVHLIGPDLAGRINSIHIEEGEGKILAVLSAPYELNSTERKDIINVARKVFSNIIINSAGKEICSEGQTSFKLHLNKSKSVYVRIPGGGFSQVNWEVNLKLIESVTNFFREENPARIMDLYGGAGNFSIPLAKDGFDILGVETDKKLVALARETAKEQGFLKKFHFEENSVNKFLKHKKFSLAENIGIIADPPRSGLGELAKDVSFAKQIVLVSCHLPSFVRDLKALLELGYQVKKIELYDMFPQTTYLESVVFLYKE